MWRQECGATFDDDTPIFPDRSGTPYQTITIRKNLFTRLKEKTGIVKLKPSMLRNSAITHDVEAGLPTSYICLRAWGEPFNDMINVYARPDSSRMQAEQHAKAGLDEVCVRKTARREVETARVCPMCGISSPANFDHCYSCGAAVSPAAIAKQAAMQMDVATCPEALKQLVDERIQAAMASRGI